MAVKIRLKRIGTKKRPFYRFVVADARSPRDGKFIEEIGYYNPLTDPKEVKIDAEKANKWIHNGAKPTDTVDRLFKEYGVYEAKEAVKEEAVVEEAPAEVVAESEEIVEEVVAEPEETVAEETQEELPSEPTEA